MYKERIGYSPKERFIREEDPITAVKKLVEDALRNIADAENQIQIRFLDEEADKLAIIKAYLPNLSVYTSILRAGEGFEENDFLLQCSYLTDIVSSALNQAAVPHYRTAVKTHASLIVPHRHTPIHVDPTMGQLVRDHSQIFVGSRTDLVDLIETSFTRNQMVNLNYYSTDDAGTLSAHPSPREILHAFWRINSPMRF